MVVMVDLEKSPKSFEEIKEGFTKKRRIYRGREQEFKEKKSLIKCIEFNSGGKS